MLGEPGIGGLSQAAANGMLAGELGSTVGKLPEAAGGVALAGELGSTLTGELGSGGHS